nr:MAG: hypothetical protein [Lokiarchaeota virus Fenrir Meg22_1012]URC17278.1 MAG: hypothetical protein [Lokiarchaeota virus Fenrir Meg22_1214]
MMKIIKVEPFGDMRYFFYFADKSCRIKIQERCYYCKKELSTVYSYLINKLREKSLLHEKFKSICCDCMYIYHTESKKIVNCSIKNCQKTIKLEDAIKIGSSYYCKPCAVALYRSMLNI